MNIDLKNIDLSLLIDVDIMVGILEEKLNYCTFLLAFKAS